MREKHLSCQFTTIHIKIQFICEKTNKFFCGGQGFFKIREIRYEVKEFIIKVKRSERDIRDKVSVNSINKILKIKLNKLESKQCQLMIADENICELDMMKSFYWYSNDLKE